MKKILVFMLATIVVLTSCKKTVEEAQQDIVTQAMTSGRWYVQQFTEDGVDITSQFTGYEFQFYDNGTVEGILSTKTETGTWLGNASALTINTNFAAAADPIKKFNALWQITNNTFTYVKANTTVSGVTRTLFLMKK